MRPIARSLYRERSRESANRKSADDEYRALGRNRHILGNNDLMPILLQRDPDVLDTWFSSALWPFSTMGWPDETAELKKYYPTSVLVTGFDIIFFWVARMMMMGLHFMKEVPFKQVYIHALVRDEKGQKMSKSKGNVMDPLVLIDEFGADALRFTLSAMAAQGRDIKLAKSRVEGYRNFATKLWNASRFAEMNECVRQQDFNPAKVEQTINKWIIGETELATKAVTEALEAYKFNEAANSAYEFVWGQFCDWYVELIKPVLSGDDEDAKTETRATTAWALDQILKMLHPFMPFITEELWAHMVEHGVARRNLLCHSEWPRLEGLVDQASDRRDQLDRAACFRNPLRAHGNERAGGRKNSARHRWRGCGSERTHATQRRYDHASRAPRRNLICQNRAEAGGFDRDRRDDSGIAVGWHHRHGGGTQAPRKSD